MLLSLHNLSSALGWTLLLCPCLSCTGELRTRHSSPGVASAVLRRRAGSPAGNTPSNTAQHTIGHLCQEGTVLTQHICPSGPLGPAEVLFMAAGLCTGLQDPQSGSWSKDLDTPALVLGHGRLGE